MKFLKSRSIFFTWFLSYLLVLGVTITLNLYAYTKIEANMFEQNNNYALELLENKKQSIDNLRSLVVDTATEISANEYVKELALEMTDLTQKTRFAMFELREKLWQFKNRNQNFEGIYIYFHEIDYVVGYASVNDAASFYNVYFQDRSLNKSEWLSLMRESHPGRYVDFTRAGEQKGQGNILYLFSVYGVERFRPWATIVIEINYPNIVSEKTGNEMEKEFLVADEEGELLLTQRGADVEEAKALLREHGAPNGVSNLGKTIMISLPSKLGDWRYVYLVEKNIFRRNINYARAALVLSNLICAGIVFWLAWALSKKNYKPVEDIAQTLGLTPYRSGDELQHIHRRIADIMEDNRKFDTIARLQDGIIRDAVLLKLLQNVPLSTNGDEIMENLGLTFAYEYFLFALFYIETNDYMFFDDKNQDEEETYRLAKLVISNVLTDMHGEGVRVYYCDVEGMLGCIVNLRRGDRLEGFLQILERLRRFTAENFNVEFMAGVSRLHRTRQALPLCYAEAMDCMEYRFFGLKDIISYEEIEHREISRYYFPPSKEEHFISFLRAGDYGGCVSVLDEIFEKNSDDAMKSAKLIKCLLYEVCAAMMKAVTDSEGESSEGDMDSLVSMMSNIGASGVTFSDMRREMYVILKSFCEKNFKDNATSMALVTEDVRRFIDENYMDPNLTVGMIADRLGITSSYLSVMFKKHAQTGLLEYITGVRMERAKQILDATDFTIEKVSEMVGYTNARSFFRMFQKYVGVSPGKYRANSMIQSR